MLAPNAAFNSAGRVRTLGDYRLLRYQGNQPPLAGTPPIGAIPADVYVGSPRPALPLGPTVGIAEVTPKPGLFRRLIDWLLSLVSPTPAPAPTPTPNPNPVPVPNPNPVPVPNPNPVPVPNPNPVPGPITGATPGVSVFFTNTYAGEINGVTKAQANAANKATSQADPNNPDKQLVSLIDSVQRGGTLDGAFFDIGVPVVVDALIRASQRGVRVRLATENDYFHVPSGSTQRPEIQKLTSAGIQVIPDDRQGPLMHDKFLVANGQTLWTGSYNITDGGSYQENNNAMRIESAELSQIYTQEFEKMFVQHNFGPDKAGAAHPASRTVRVGNAEITPYFSPSSAAQGGCKAAIMAELANAKQSIQFLAFSFADDDMGALMLKKAGEGVKVEGVFEKSQAASRYSEYQTMNPAEAQLNADGQKRLDVRIDTNPALMHHKVMIIDDSTLIMGSFNFSQSAQSENDENMLVIKNAPDLVARYKAEFARVQAVAQ